MNSVSRWRNWTRKHWSCIKRWVAWGSHTIEGQINCAFEGKNHTCFGNFNWSQPARRLSIKRMSWRGTKTSRESKKWFKTTKSKKARALESGAFLAYWRAFVSIPISLLRHLFFVSGIGAILEASSRGITNDILLYTDLLSGAATPTKMY